jgi:hypothetical protein
MRAPEFTNGLTSGSAHQVQCVAPMRSFETADSLRIQSRKLEMRLSDVCVLGNFRGRGLFGRPALVINEIRFHDRHPPMAPAPKRGMRVADLMPPHISAAHVNPLI